MVAKSIILDDMLIDLIGKRNYEELDNKDKIKVHKLLRERGKLFNKPVS